MRHDASDILDLVPDLAIRIDGDGKICHLNRAATTFLGAHCMDQPAKELLPVEAVEALAGKAPEPARVRAYTGSNHVIHWELAELDGSPLLLGRDISEQVEATEALADRMRRLEALHTITLAISRGEDLDGICDVAFRQLTRIVPIVRGGVARLEASTLAVFYTWNRGVQPTPEDRVLGLDETPAGAAIHRRATVQMRTTGSAALQWAQLRRLQAGGCAPCCTSRSSPSTGCWA